MTDRSKTKQKGGTTREERLRAALRANLQRRKAQARARAAQADQDNKNENETGGDDS
ncbi:hypothetical protein [Paracoccus seriniphilus]|uniref:hypothetical protein n=1 Tax=Paracoccus seriniphilus TaxID=184748 RepID=UPI0015C64A95|nr:hypothetical protein [Paracoccus seriniphilus]WCR13129.1 hypothetical protein JHW44_09255 [Paracoccus seriniphilus]